MDFQQELLVKIYTDTLVTEISMMLNTYYVQSYLRNYILMQSFR